MERQILISPHEEDGAIYLDFMENEELVFQISADLVDDSKLIRSVIEMWMRGQSKAEIDSLCEDHWA